MIAKNRLFSWIEQVSEVICSGAAMRRCWCNLPKCMQRNGLAHSDNPLSGKRAQPKPHDWRHSSLERQNEDIGNLEVKADFYSGQLERKTKFGSIMQTTFS